MILVKNKLRVLHYPQVPCKPFIVDVRDEEQAHFICGTLSKQHAFLLEHGMIPYYANVFNVEMWDEGDGKWVEYYNERESMDFNEFVDTYLDDGAVEANNSIEDEVLQIYRYRLKKAEEMLVSLTLKGGKESTKIRELVNNQALKYRELISIMTRK